MADVKLEKVIKDYDELRVIHGVDLTIRNGEFVVFVGPSGCGKSTLLRMIAGLEEITGGKVYIGDRIVNHLAPKDRNVAMVFQDYALYPHMNVRQNLAFGLKMRKTAQDEIDRRIEYASEMLQIHALLERKPKALSGGQRQRVAIGRAIVRKPNVFLFDEPLSNLDANLRSHMRIEIAKIHRKINNTSIYVTHDQSEAMTLADKIVVIKDGHIMQIGTPDEIYNTPQNRFVAEFIGSPSMNFLNLESYVQDSVHHFENEGVKLEISEKTMKAGELPSRLILGIRPEDIHIKGQSTGGLHLSSSFSCEVEVVENLGSEKYVIVTSGENRMILKTAAKESVSVGDRIELSLAVEKLHFFDVQSEKRLDV